MSSVNPLRIAIVSTPRSGNTWLRYLVARVFGIPELSRHRLSRNEWRDLPPEIVLQLHHRREPEFEATLAEHGFRVLTISRHPLDVLISILHVAVHEIESEHWLDGRHGDERTIWGAMPRSRCFLDYAVSPRAAELLAVTSDWWQQPDCVSVRYEDCVRDTTAVLEHLESAFGRPRQVEFATALAENSLSRLRGTATNNHFWKGQPGLWRELLPEPEAREIAQAHSAILANLGYVCDPDPVLDPLTADRTWIRYAGTELRATLQKNTKAFRNTLEQERGHTAAAQAQVSGLQAELLGARAEAADVGARLAEVSARLADTQHQCESQAAQIMHERATAATLLDQERTAANNLLAQEREAAAAVLLREQQEAAARISHLSQELSVHVIEGEQLREQLITAQARLAEFDGLSGFGLRVARRLTRMQDRYPEVTATVRRALGKANAVPPPAELTMDDPATQSQDRSQIGRVRGAD